MQSPYIQFIPNQTSLLTTRSIISLFSTYATTENLTFKFLADVEEQRFETDALVRLQAFLVWNILKQVSPQSGTSHKEQYQWDHPLSPLVEHSRHFLKTPTDCGTWDSKFPNLTSSGTQHTQFLCKTQSSHPCRTDISVWETLLSAVTK